MLTVDQIKNVSFKKASIGGYRCDEVDNFIDDVVDTVESLKKEKSEILGKLEILMKRIEEYRQDEDSVHNALLSAQKLADKSLKDSRQESEQILIEAKAEADRIIKDANDRIIREKEMIVKIEQEAADIREKMIAAYEKQINALKAFPEQLEVDKIKADLDKEYPTEIYSPPAETPLAEEDTFKTIEEAVEDAISDTPSAEPAVPETEEDNSTIQIEKSAFERKFGKLKFGDDYDVASEK